MLPIQPECNSLLLVNGVQYSVSILFDSSCENDYLIVFGHLIQKLLTVWPYQEGMLRPFNFLVMDKSLIHIQNQGVFLFAL